MKKGIQREEKEFAALLNSKKGISDAKNTWNVMVHAPILIVVLNTNGRTSFEEIDADNRVTEICDTLSIGASIENMLLKATEIGLGTLWIANTCYAYTELTTYLDTDCQLVGAIALANLWKEYIAIAAQYKLPFWATTPTRRANYERVRMANCSDSIIADNVKFLRNIQHDSGIEMYVGGLMGCKGDAYTGEGALSEAEAYDFHSWQAERFGKAEADFLYAGIMPVLSEAAGMAKAMEATGLPYIISFTIQKDGKLIDGTTITEAIQYIDRVTTKPPVCYMTNCVHPTIVYQALIQPFNQNQVILDRFWGIQANTSPLSYAELDGSVDLKCSEPEDFAKEMLKLRAISAIKIFGGCCGTDNRHMECVARAL